MQNETMQPVVGEVYLCSQDSEGEPILLKNFKGVKISKICGGYYRAFILEKDSEGKGKIHSLHPPEYDEYDYTFTEKNLEDLAMTQKEIESEIQNRFGNKNLVEKLNDQNESPELMKQNRSGRSLYSSDAAGGGSALYQNEFGDTHMEAQAHAERRELSEVREDEAEVPDRHYFGSKSQRDENQSQEGQLQEEIEFHVEEGYHQERHDEKMIGENGEKIDDFDGQEEQHGYEEEHAYGEENYEDDNGEKEYQVERLSHKMDEADDRKQSIQTETATKIYSAFDGRGTIKEIKSGRNHIMLLNTDGQLYSYGYGEYGVMGRGMAVYSPVPMQITNVQKHKITKVACGYQHCLGLNAKGDVFSWGRGFEGQLGLMMNDIIPQTFDQKLYSKPSLPEVYTMPDDDQVISLRRKPGQKKAPEPPIRPPVQIECCSFPRVIRSFTKKILETVIVKDRRSSVEVTKKTTSELTDDIITDVECGAYHSLAITKAGKLYGWGDSGCGQLGIGRKPKVFIPTEIVIKERVVQAAAGFAHTLCITSEGFVYSFGLNFKYQLGFDDQKARYKPERLMVDDNDLPMKSIIKISSGDYNCFALTDDGKVYSWGSGVLGFKDLSILTRPKLIKGSVGERRITDIYVNSGNAIFFSPAKIVSMKPSSGPSTGGTIFSIIGVGLCDMRGKQRLKFVYGHADQYKIDVDLNYDESTNSYFAQTPNFEAQSIYDPSQWPAKAKIAFTLDGETWFDSDLTYFIFSSKIKISNINPRFASIEGGLEMCIELVTDQKTMKEFSAVSVGFQATDIGSRTEVLKSKTIESEKTVQKDAIKSVNPVDIPVNSAELTKPDWIYFEGTVRDKDIIFKVPPLAKQNCNSLFYNLDVSLNGQQFLGSPSFFRYYMIQITDLTPDTTVNNGGTLITVRGNGFIDSQQKKIRLSNSRTQRLIDVKWDKEKEEYYFYTPPISWLSGREDDLTETEIDEVAAEDVSVAITISGKDWINIGKYKYYEPKVKQLLPGPVADKHLTEDAIREHWPKPEPIVNPLEGLTDKEADKKRTEFEKRHKEDLHEIEHVFRKPHSLLYVEGESFINKGSLMIARINYKEFHKDIPIVFKNSTKVGIEVPVIEGPSEGIHDMSINLSFNGGQDFGQHTLKFKYYCFNKDTPDAERTKLMDAELKNAKKAKK